MATTQNMPRVETRRQEKKRKAASNSEIGRLKGGACTCTQLDKAMTFRNRSYKMTEYPDWKALMDIKYEKYK